MSGRTIGTGVEIEIHTTSIVADNADLFAPLATGTESGPCAEDGNLYVARVFVEAMGGMIKARAESGEGGTMAIWLPATGS